jgi:PAS domain S-box-containing protein
MTGVFEFVERVIWPDKPRGLVTRYGLALALPLGSVAITHAMFPLDTSLFSPLLALSIVCAATFGGIQVGILATAESLVLSVLALRRAGGPWQISHPKDVLNGFAFVLAGILVSFVAGSAGALNRRVAIERRKLEMTLSCIGDAVISTDLQGRVRFINPAAEMATGWNLSEAEGKDSEEVFQILNQETRVSVDSPIRRVLATGEEAGLARGTVLMRRDGSEIPVSDSATPIRDYHGKIIGAVMVFRDISNHQQREQTWLQTQRLASVGRLAATIAHELNNPLQAVSNLLFLIGQERDPLAIHHYTIEASQELRRASEIAKQTLSFVRGAGERNPVSVGQLFEEVLLLNRNKLKNKNIQVDRRYISEVMVTARTGEIRQVLGNLVGNALDALEFNGKLYLRAKPLEYSGAPAVQFVVADNGSGMSREHQARVFEPFFTTKKDVGTGLGLWVVKNILDREGGSVSIRSKVGEGTVARLRWPSRTEQDANAIAL